MIQSPDLEWCSGSLCAWAAMQEDRDGIGWSLEFCDKAENLACGLEQRPEYLCLAVLHQLARMWAVQERRQSNIWKRTTKVLSKPIGFKDVRVLDAKSSQHCHTMRIETTTYIYVHGAVLGIRAADSLLL